MFERCLYFNVNTLSRKVNRLWKEAYSEVGLSPSHAYLLRLVLAKPGLSQQAIADELNLEKSTVTRFIDKIEAEGFIVRTISATRSTREQSIFPTEKAKRLHDRLEQIGDNLYTEVLKIIGETDLKTLVKDLREAGRKI
jgi:DNA-binding MarR family transcriptional regulator